MKILFVTQVYPNKKHPGIAIFLKQLVHSFNLRGIDTNVLKPTSFKIYFNKRDEYDEIFCPLFLSFGDKIFRRLTLFNFILTTIIFIKKLNKKPDVLYAKFLYFSGGACYFINKFFGIPYFIDIGESNIFYYRNKFDMFLKKKFLSNATGIICVSSKLKNQILSCGISESKILLAQNSVDPTKFKVLDPVIARNILGLNHDDFIILFVGHFNYRKGPDRLLSAVDLGNFPSNVKLVFLGTGETSLESGRILFKGEVTIDNLVFWLNASNLFALPTLAEGNSNAINEALSIGLPIICSDIKELHDQIPDNHATFFNPFDINSIQNAIKLNISNTIVRFKPVLFNINRNDMILEWIHKKLGNNNLNNN